MQPIMFVTVGYIIGIIWGLYLKRNIVPIFFIVFGGIFLLCSKNRMINKYKIGILLLFIFIVISNIQTNILENKFKNLYKDIDEISAVRCGFR